MDKEKITAVARRYALQNAIQFNGTANPKAVIGKVMAHFNKDEISPKQIIPIVKTVVKNVNQLDVDQQREELQETAPELLEKEKKEKTPALPPLPHAEEGNVVTRFPPEPNGYLHIGHAKAAIIDHEYARRYNGRFILRFDDTNPENAHEEFYEAQRQDLRWLGIEWDEEYHTSDNLEKHYQLAEQLIKQGDAYLCECPPEQVKDSRYHGKECTCRSCSPEKNLDRWNEMLSSSEITNTILRLKGDLTCPNTAMRDPTLFRIIEAEHPIQGDKYRVWPTYDFAGAIEDSLSGVTHPFRTKEYELRDQCYFYLLDKLQLRKPHLMEFARLSIEGMPVSKRKIKPLIEQQKVSGFNDVRLPTLRGLKRRGIQPEAIKQFVISQGISKAESSVTFDQLEAVNRKIIDPTAPRYFFIPNPIKIQVENAPKKTVSLPLHPTEDLGTRTIKTQDVFYIPREDANELEVNTIFRLKDLYNIKIEQKNQSITASYQGEKLLPNTAKIQWTTKNHIPLTVYRPHPLLKENGEFNANSLEEITGYAEETIKQLPNGAILQFERFGFVRLEKTNDTIKAFFTHK